MIVTYCGTSKYFETGRAKSKTFTHTDTKFGDYLGDESSVGSLGGSHRAMGVRGESQWSRRAAHEAAPGGRHLHHACLARRRSASASSARPCSSRTRARPYIKLMVRGCRGV